MQRSLTYLSLVPLTLLVSCGGKVAMDPDGRGDFGGHHGDEQGENAAPETDMRPDPARDAPVTGDASPSPEPTAPPRPPEPPRVDPPCPSGAQCPERCDSDDCIVGLALGPFHTCAVLEDGSLRCWGANGSGQLGLGFATEKEATARLSFAADVSEVSVAQDHSCVVHSDRTVSCWGGNDVGQLGRGSTTGMEFAIAPVAGVDEVVQLVSGLEHTCALHADGAVSCWGANDDAQLGRGHLSDAGALPSRVSGLDATHLAAGRFHTCAIETRGTVSCWGHSITGTHRDLVPTRVEQVAEVTEVGAGFMRTCAVLRSGRVDCWSEAGISEITELVDTVEVGWGHFQGCALDLFGTVRCWGQNAFGELGIGIETEANQPPTEVSLRVPATEVRTTNSHSCARLEDGSLWCWGPNFNGENGDGTFEPRPYPVRVRW